jgi:N-acetyl-alpha-D-glucosaminyl L-malate synthase BshA
VNVGIACYPTVGGSGAVATELGKQLARRGHEVHLISYRLPFRLRNFLDRICFHSVEVVSYSLFEYPPHDLALAAKMAEVIRNHHLEILHVHYAIPHAIAGVIARDMVGGNRPKLVTTLHGTDITLVGQDRSFVEITRYGIARSDGVTAVSEFLARMTREELDVSGPIEVIPNFVDLEQYAPEQAHADVSAFAQPGDVILVHMSNFRPIKRVLDAVRVLERVNRQRPAVLLMVGDGPERTAAQALARRLGVEERVRFLGQRDSAESLLALADLFLLPTELESFGLAALEAMACGVPVIGTDAGGLPEVVRSGETGVLVPVGDVEAMARTALEILESPGRRKTMGAAARRRAVEHFGVEQVVGRYESFYERVLAE